MSSTRQIQKIFIWIILLGFITSCVEKELMKTENLDGEKGSDIVGDASQITRPGDDSNFGQDTDLPFSEAVLVECNNCQTFYVSPGENSGDGTLESPWSLYYAFRNAPAGSIVIVQNGEYSYSDSGLRVMARGTQTEPIIFKAEDVHQAKIQVSHSAKYEAAITFGIYNPNLGKNTPNLDFYVVFDGLDISGGSIHTMQVDGASHVSIINSKIHESNRGEGVKNNNNANYNLYENNDIYDTGVNCPADKCNADGIDITSSTGVVVRANHIHNTGTWGAYAKKWSQNILFEKNIIHHTGSGGISLGESTPVQNSIARKNILYNIPGACLQSQGGQKVKFLYNTCYLVGSDSASYAPLRLASAERYYTAKSLGTEREVIPQWNVNILDTNGNGILDDSEVPCDDCSSQESEISDLSNKIRNDENFAPLQIYGDVEMAHNILVINNNFGSCFSASTSYVSWTDSLRTKMIQGLNIHDNICHNLTADVPYQFKYHRSSFQIGIDNWHSHTQGIGRKLNENISFDSPEFLSVDPTNPDFLKPGNSVAVLKGAFED